MDSLSTPLFIVTICVPKKKMKLLRIRMGISSNKIVLSFSFDFWGILEKKVASIVVLEDFPRFSISNRKIWLILRAKQKF